MRRSASSAVAPLATSIVIPSSPNHDADTRPGARHPFSPVAQTFLSAGSGDFPVPSAILETVLESTVNPQAGKPALLAADTLSRDGAGGEDPSARLPAKVRRVTPEHESALAYQTILRLVPSWHGIARRARRQIRSPRRDRRRQRASRNGGVVR